VKEAVNISLFSMTGLKYLVKHQVEKLTEAIQQLQQRIIDLELCTLPNTLQDVRDQRDATTRSIVERIKDLSMECKQLSDRSA
jgi:septation ring formation regulator EzrA